MMLCRFRQHASSLSTTLLSRFALAGPLHGSPVAFALLAVMLAAEQLQVARAGIRQAAETLVSMLS